MNYCTIFDSSYLSRGLACYKSLLNVEPDCHLYIFCLDMKCSEILLSEGLVNCTVLSPHDFEDAELLSIKSKRTRGEYAWTVKPFAIGYTFSRFKVDECSYIDSDLYFYAAPKLLSEHYHGYSAVLTPHNFSRLHDTSARNGIYCGQFVKFCNDELGNQLLKWWKERCSEWCYNKHEPGRFGDQKYLEYLALQPSVAVVDFAVLAAPWNIARYKFISQGAVILAEDCERTGFQPVIFFHFHGFKLLSRFAVDLGGYKVTKNALRQFYLPYARELLAVNRRIASRYGVKSIDWHRLELRLTGFLRAIRNWFVGRYRLVFL